MGNVRSGFTLLLGNLKFVRAEAVAEEEADTLVQKAWLIRLCWVVIIAFTFQKRIGYFCRPHSNLISRNIIFAAFGL